MSWKQNKLNKNIIIIFPHSKNHTLADSLDAGFTINTTIRFQGSTGQLSTVNIPIDVLDDSMTEKQKQFIVSILRIDILNTEFSTGSTTGARTAIDGDSVRITIYDNDCKYYTTTTVSIMIIIVPASAMISYIYSTELTSKCTGRCSGYICMCMHVLHVQCTHKIPS